MILGWNIGYVQKKLLIDLYKNEADLIINEEITHISSSEVNWCKKFVAPNLHVFAPNDRECSLGFLECKVIF